MRNIISKALRAAVPLHLRPSGSLKNLVRKRTKNRVYSGPFAGMLWIEANQRDADFDIPKLLGIYERELNSCIEQACAHHFPLIVDVGAAEGYYAVGLALRNPTTQVIAFEMQKRERAQLEEKAKLNSVSERIEIRGMCEPEDLENALSNVPRPFVIIDTEGYELKLLDPSLVPSLARAYILVELHEFAVKGIGETIRGWYGGTHHITETWHEERNPKDFPFTSFYARLLPQAYHQWAVGESRPERMSWLWMEPIQPHGS